MKKILIALSSVAVMFAFSNCACCPALGEKSCCGKGGKCCKTCSSTPSSK